MNCTICHKPIKLVPSAAERAAKYGGSPEHYTRLFQQHNECLLRKRAEDTAELMKRIREKYARLSPMPKEGPPSA